MRIDEVCVVFVRAPVTRDSPYCFRSEWESPNDVDSLEAKGLNLPDSPMLVPTTDVGLFYIQNTGVV